jgi:signal transduction protein with GAF and PtsI domain
MDAVDTVKLIRRFFFIVATCPSNLEVRYIAAHTVSRDLCDAFEVGVISLYLDAPERPGCMHKYTPRPNRRELVDVTSSPCLVGAVMRHVSPLRLNNLEDTAYNPLIDGIKGFKVQRMLLMPLIDRISDRVLGVISFINKHENDVFTYCDELFVKIFASMLETALCCCLHHERILGQRELQETLLRVSVDFASTIPSKDSLAVGRPVLIGEKEGKGRKRRDEERSGRTKPL